MAVVQNSNALKFSRDLGAEICRAIARVGHESLAAEICGVHRHTVRNWRERGDAGEPEFADFARELRTAKALFIESKLPNVKSMEWLLERLDREVFSAPQKHELTGRDGGAMEHAHKVTHSLSREQSVEIVSKILGVPRDMVEGKFKGSEPVLEEEAEDGDEQ